MNECDCVSSDWRTVEINNTDAEGRLVLADGVVYASKDLAADIILDMATLTGAQVGVSVGSLRMSASSFPNKLECFTTRRRPWSLDQFLASQSQLSQSCPGLRLDRVGIFDQEISRRLRWLCEDTLISENNLAAALLCSVGDNLEWYKLSRGKIIKRCPADDKC